MSVEQPGRPQTTSNCVRGRPDRIKIKIIIKSENNWIVLLQNGGGAASSTWDNYVYGPGPTWLLHPHFVARLFNYFHFLIIILFLFCQVDPARNCLWSGVDLAAPLSFSSKCNQLFSFYRNKYFYFKFKVNYV